MNLEIRKLFSAAASYAGYYSNILSIIPSGKVREALEKEGWQFKSSEYCDVAIHAADGNNSGMGLPLEVVMTETGTHVYKSANPQTIQRYETAKKRAASAVYGISP